MKKVLIVVDMQNDFVTGALGNPAAQAIVPNVVKKVEEYIDRGDYVIFTKDTHNVDYLDTQEGKKLPISHCIMNSKGHRIIPQLLDLCMMNNSHSICKFSFGFDDWKNYFESHIFRNEECPDISHISEIELIGLVTDICVVSNAVIIKATFPEVPMKVDGRCCAGLTPEKHEAALSVMESIQIEVIR